MKQRLIPVLDKVGLLPLALNGKRRLRRLRSTVQRRVRLARARGSVTSGPGKGTIFVGDWPVAGRRVDDVDAVSERARNLDEVRSTFAAAGLAHFVSKAAEPGRTRVGVFGSAEHVLAALERRDADATLSVERNSDIVRAVSPVGASSLMPLLKPGDLVLVHRPVFLDGPGRAIDGLDTACEIERWAPQSRGSSVFVTLSANPVSDTMTLTGHPRGFVDVPEFSWSGDHWEPPFEIDAVYTWVDGADPAWLERRHRHEPVDATADGTGAERYENFDELRYSLRSIRQHAPFFRNIYVVTDQQRPEWLIDGAGVTIIDHTEIFRATDALPVFNSHAIESQLHHIPGLAERYVYMNDDVFFGRNVAWTNLFTVGGLARFAESAARIPIRPAPDAPAVDHSGANAQQLLIELVGFAPSRKIKHTPHPQIRSIHDELEQRIPEVYERVARSRFRSIHDISLAALLHHRYGEATGRAIPGRFDYDYLNLSRSDLAALLERLRERRPMTFCLNDAALPTEDRREVKRLLENTLEGMFPVRAPWEHPAQSAPSP